MSWGQVTKIDAFINKTTYRGLPTLPIDANPFEKCCYNLTVFADLADDDEYKNDWSTWVEFYSKIYTVTIKLQQLVNDTWTDLATLADDTYGEYLNDYPTRNNINLIGYKVRWQLILDDFGIGQFRLKFTDNATSVIRYSPEYCLKNFNSDDADNSVRVDYYLNSHIGDDDQKLRRDFAGFNVPFQLRFMNAAFGYPTAELTKETNRYNSGYELSHVKMFRKKFYMEVFDLPMELHNVLLNDILMADDIFVTDYNQLNSSGTFANVAVEIDGNWEPNYNKDTATPSVRLNFIDKYNNNRKEFS